MSGLSGTGNFRITRAQTSRTQPNRSIDSTTALGPKGIDALIKSTDLEERLQQTAAQTQKEIHQQRLVYIKQALQETEVLSALQSLHFKELSIQCGSGTIPEVFKKVDGVAEQSWNWFDVQCGIQISIFHYKKDIRADMQRADLIIGHAGAGTTLESLELGKPLVVVINEALADNHQLELAERLAKDRHLLFTVPGKLAKTLKDANIFGLEPFHSADPSLFADFLDIQLGIKSD